MNENKVQELQDVVIRFSGDSGDGMQLTGTLFSDTSALLGNGISTFPDYPAEIRAPQIRCRACGAEAVAVEVDAVAAGARTP